MNKLTNISAAVTAYQTAGQRVGNDSTITGSKEMAEENIPNQTLLAIFEAACVIEAAPNLTAGLRQTTEAVLKLVPAEGSLIALLDTNQNWSYVRGGAHLAMLDGCSIQPAERPDGLLETAWHSRKLAASTQSNPVVLSEQEASAYYGLAIPLQRSGQSFGVLALVRSTSQGEATEFSAGEAKVLELFAQQVGPLLGAAQRISDLETALKSRDEFLSIASHDLRNPLTALKGFGQLTVRAIDKVPEGQPIPRQTIQNNMQRIIKQTNSLDKLIGKLLDVSRINTGRLEIRPDRLELAELVREAAERFAVATMTVETDEGRDPEQRHPIQLEVSSEELWGQFDRERIEQLITNLLDNAVKYSPDGGIVTIRLRRLAPATAELSIIDQGIGIPKEKHFVIFNRWSRIYSARDGEVGEVNGLGLGLFICREIARKHNGQISLQSKLGEGSTFVVTLPLQDQE